MKKELFITQEVRRRGKKRGYDFAKTEYEINPIDKYRVEIPCDLLIYDTVGAIPFLVECPQGTVDSYRCFYGGKEREIKDPGYNHEKIINSYLFVIQEINKILIGCLKKEVISITLPLSSDVFRYRSNDVFCHYTSLCKR